MTSAWIAEGGGVRAVPLGEALACARQGAGAAWIDLDSDDEAAARAVLEPLDVHPLVMEDVVTHVNRPKVDNYGAYLYLVVHSARWNEDRPTLREIDVVLGERFIVTCHEGPTRSVDAAREVLPRRPELLASGPAPLLHFMLDALVDHYLPIADRIGEEIDRLEEQVFEEGDERAVHERVVRLKRGMAALRRVLGPQRDTVLALTRDEFRPVPAALRPYLRDVYDRLARVTDLLDSFRDETSTLLELHVSVVSNRLNEIIKRLTVIATVGLPLTVVTGYYGMNFALPEYRWPHAEWYAVGLLALTAGATWWYLRRRRWS